MLYDRMSDQRLKEWVGYEADGTLDCLPDATFLRELIRALVKEREYAEDRDRVVSEFVVGECVGHFD